MEEDTITAKETQRPPTGAPGSRGVWAMTVLLAVLTAGIFFGLQRHQAAPLSSVDIPWWLLAIGFFVAEVYVVHLEFRSSAHSFALSEIPLVIGIFFAAPGTVLLAQLLGAAVALFLARRQKLLKAVFNLALLGLGSVLVSLIFRTILGNEDASSTRGWVAMLVALIVTNAISITLIVAAIAFVERGFERRAFMGILTIGLIVTVTNGCLSLIGVEIMVVDRSAAWLLLVPAATLFLAYRGYSEQRHKLSSLSFLYEATRETQSSRKTEDVMMSLLIKAREMFAAELSEITFFPSTAGEKAQTARLGPGEKVTPLHEIDLDPTEGVWARVASEGEALLLQRPMANPQLRAHYEARGIRDAMVAPLRTDAGVVGTMTIGNHLGDVSTFDDEDLLLLETLVNHASVWLENARLIDRLEESLAHLTEMNRLKDDFVATVSHELRTPLTSIQGYVKTLLRPEATFDAAEQRSFLEVIERQSARLRNLIEDLLVVSRLESHQEPPNLGTISLDSIIAQVLEELDAGDHRIEIDLPGDLPGVLSDESKLIQILTNLVGNAIKYSPSESKVSVAAYVESDGITVSVSDKGSGIPEDLTERVFERFFQVDQSTTRVSGGTGLGLYISRRLADIIGARVWLETSTEMGSVFSLWIPPAPPIREDYLASLPAQVDP